MQGSFLDFVPPEAHGYVGAIGLVTAAIGFVVWSCGFKIARFCVSMLCGAGCAVVAAYFLPKVIFVSPLSSALVGFAVGAVTGALGFRLLQGLTLAVCLGVAVSAVYYHWHVGAEMGATTTAAQTVPATLVTSGTQAATDLATAFMRNLNDRWAAIPTLHQKRLMAAGIGTAAVVLLIAFGFARHTTLIVSALLGAIMMAAGVQALVQIYAPEYERFFQVAWVWRLLTLGGVTLVGVGIQRHFHWRRKVVVVRAEPVADGATPPPPGPR